MNKFSGVFIKRGGFSSEGLNLIGKEASKSLGGGSNSANYRSKRDAFFMDFRLSIDFWGLGVVRNKAFLDDRIEGGGFYGFGDKACDGINMVLGKRFISGGGEEGNIFSFIVGGVHDD